MHNVQDDKSYNVQDNKSYIMSKQISHIQCPRGQVMCRVQDDKSYVMSNMTLKFIFISQFFNLCPHLHFTRHLIQSWMPGSHSFSVCTYQCMSVRLTNTLVWFLVPHFWNNDTPILSQYAKAIMKTSVSSEQITTVG